MDSSNLDVHKCFITTFVHYFGYKVYFEFFFWLLLLTFEFCSICIYAYIFFV